MIQEDLKKRIDDIFREFGGIEAARRIFTDSELTTLSLFNGYTAPLFPHYVQNEGNVTNGLDSYYYLDLALIADYELGADLSYFDKYLNHILTVTPLVEEGDYGPEARLGVTAAEQSLLKGLESTTLLYVGYKTSNGPRLMQLIVSLNLPVSMFELNSDRWNEMAENQDSESARENEITLLPPKDKSTQIAIHYGPRSLNLTNGSIFRKSQDILVSSGTPVYLRLNKPTWLAFRTVDTYLDIESESAVIGKTLTEARTILQGLSYTEVGDSIPESAARAVVFEKAGSEGTIALTVSVGRLSEVVRLEAEEYKTQNILEKTGTKLWAIVSLDGGGHIQLGGAEPMALNASLQNTEGRIALNFSDREKITAALTIGSL